MFLQNGRLVAAAEEERFTRKKHDFEFHYNAIRFCLAQGNVNNKDLGYVVFFEKLFTKFDRILRTSLQGFPRTYRLFLQSMRTWLSDKLWVKSLIAKSVGVEPNRILFSEHHLSHAASSYFCSPFEESATLTVDAVGEWSSTTMGVGKGIDLILTKELHFPTQSGCYTALSPPFWVSKLMKGNAK